MTAFGKQPGKVFVKVSDWALRGSAVSLLLTEKQKPPAFQEEWQHNLSCIN